MEFEDHKSVRKFEGPLQYGERMAAAIYLRDNRQSKKNKKENAANEKERIAIRDKKRDKIMSAPTRISKYKKK